MGRRAYLGPNERVAVAALVQFRQFDEEAVLLNLSTGQYFSLNAVGARMWQELVAGKTAAEVAALLTEEYEREADAILLDCLALAEELLERALLRRI